MDPDDHLEDGNDAYTNLIEESKGFLQLLNYCLTYNYIYLIGFTTENRKTLLDHLREVLKSAEKAHKNVRDFAQRRIDLVMRDTGVRFIYSSLKITNNLIFQTDPTFDQSLEKIEIDRLQELALLQTFEVKKRKIIMTFFCGDLHVFIIIRYSTKN